MLRPDGRPVLLDFGSARSALNRGTRTVTSLVTPGYAPYEQYYNDGNQGPWTDIYGLGAIMHQIVAGKPPVEAPARLKNDPLPAARAIGAGRYPEPMLAAIDWAMASTKPAAAKHRRLASRPCRRGQAKPLVAFATIASPTPTHRRRRRGLLIAASVTRCLSRRPPLSALTNIAPCSRKRRAKWPPAVAQRDAEHAPSAGGAWRARSKRARMPTIAQANEEAAEKARLAEEKRKAEEATRAAAAEKERQAQQARRIRDSEEQTRKALAEAQTRARPKSAP